MYYIICFDISSNKRRYQINKTLQNHGKRVQKSVYEIYIRKESELKQLKKQLRRHMGKDDSIIIYHFPENARQRSENLTGAPIAYFPAAIIL